MKAAAVFPATLLATLLTTFVTSAPVGAQIQGNGGAEPCGKAPHCAWSRDRNGITHELRKPDLGWGTSALNSVLLTIAFRALFLAF